jgi:hypothetical protein
MGSIAKSHRKFGSFRRSFQMKKLALRILALFTLMALAQSTPTFSRAEEKADPDEITADSKQSESSSDASVAAEKSKEEVSAEDVETPVAKPARTPRRSDRADAFVAGADWEFDGFVAGGQDSNIRSMFYLNDLVYVNIGSQHGMSTGDKIGIYKRGDRVKDPQTGKFIGYEVRRAAIGRATDRVEDEVAAVRITNTYEAVEVGDLVRKEQ